MLSSECQPYFELPIIFCIKVGLHVTSAFAFSFDICRHILENANVKCEHNHLLLQNPLLTFDANTNADVTCKQGSSNTGNFWWLGWFRLFAPKFWEGGGDLRMPFLIL